jgi:hypothetical protein
VSSSYIGRCGGNCVTEDNNTVSLHVETKVKRQNWLFAVAAGGRVKL